MRVYLNKNIYFLVCLVLVIGVSSIRSYPVYGKLDFILLNGRPWWNPWRPMIEQIVQENKRPILSDMITSSVLRAVFAQAAVGFRFDHRFGRIDIEDFLAFNTPLKKMLPAGGLVLLLGSGAEWRAEQKKYSGEPRNTTVRETVVRGAEAEMEQREAEPKEYPYRCLINLHGFEPSWVPVEIRHWSWRWAEPSLIYEFKGKRGKDMEQQLHDNPPDNCTVFF